MKRKRVSLCEVIEVVVTLLQPNLGLKKASLRNDLDGLRHCCILGDPNRLEVMFSALVSNAVAAIPVGGSIHIHGEAKGDHQSEIYIDDNGGGIPAQSWSQVFEPFFTTKPAGQGTGLGLAIARNIAEEHGGDLRLQNRTGGGVRATVRLPLLDVEAVSGAAEAKEKNV
jgi:signal transduction histidine kinase